MDKLFLNIVFWGEDSFSNIVLNSLIEAGHCVKLVVTPLYDNLIYKKLQFTCLKFGIPFERYFKINTEEVLMRIKKCSPDLCVIAHFERLIKSPILEIPHLGFINLHPSLLPDYRGMAPQHWPIIDGRDKTGITIHYVDSGVDTGDIIMQENIAISEDMYVSDLQNRWIEIYRYIVVDAINRILTGHPIIKQSHLDGCYYGKLKVEQCQIDLTTTCQSTYNLIRGVSMPYFGARIDNVVIWKTHYATPDLFQDITINYPINGLYMDTEYGNFLKLENGVLIIDKYKKIQNGR